MKEANQVWMINGEAIELNEQTAEMLKVLSDPKQVKAIADDLIHFSDTAKDGFINIQNQGLIKRLMGEVTGRNSQEMATAIENNNEAMRFLGYLSTCLYLQNVQWNEQMISLQPMLEEWKANEAEWKGIVELQAGYQKVKQELEEQQKQWVELHTRLTLLGKDCKAIDQWKTELEYQVQRIAEQAEATEKKSRKSISELRLLQEDVAREMREQKEKMKLELKAFQTEAQEFMEREAKRSTLLHERMTLLQAYIEMPWWRRIFARSHRRQIAATRETE
ncbi:hypothetical protein [Ammoniphilus sp. YIM 78166]|uniref:hypothetical protein n=1 Tax=Ammoniphilus sp. YIM 78166 TaxID=1644106 RepID=UPI00106F8B4A|nr:hypothetical protein [Ammoniphilus sp. YIM 78166]